MKLIIHKSNDGRVYITVPVEPMNYLESEDDYLNRIKDRAEHCMDSKNLEFVGFITKEKLPESKEFRDSWEWDNVNKEIIENEEKKEVIKNDRLGIE